VEEAEKAGIRFHVGNLVSSDCFYHEEAVAGTWLASWKKMGVLAVEMEAAALYMNAARMGKGALALCTVSDHLITGEVTDSETRQTALRDMIELALRLSVKL